MSVRILTGDCRELLATLDAESIDAVVTDPPYGIGFMGREWDTFAPERVAKREAARNRKGTHRREGPWSHKDGTGQGGGVAVEYDETASGNRRFQAWTEQWATEAFRVLKPGGHLVCFGGCRTFHRVTAGIEDAGFEIRDVLCYLFGSGFPKSKNLSGEWTGWGSALKPGWEPAILARKPLAGTIAQNVERFGTGAINIDGCRIAGDYETRQRNNDGGNSIFGTGAGGGAFVPASGRWPANVVLDEDAAAALDAMSGERKSSSGQKSINRQRPFGEGRWRPDDHDFAGDIGGASRFFYTAKASRAERNLGLAGLPERKPHPDEPNGRVWDIPGSHSLPRANHHPTVKPLSLMRWLVRLVTPPNGLVLDPFLGSGTTGMAAKIEGFRFVGIELDEAYVEIARRRIGAVDVGSTQLELVS